MSRLPRTAARSTLRPDRPVRSITRRPASLPLAAALTVVLAVVVAVAAGGSGGLALAAGAPSGHSAFAVRSQRHTAGHTAASGRQTAFSSLPAAVRRSVERELARGHVTSSGSAARAVTRSVRSSRAVPHSVVPHPVDRTLARPHALTSNALVTPAPAASGSYQGSGSEQLGYGVAVSADGSTIVVSAPSAGSGAGALLIFTESSGAWSTDPVVITGSESAPIGTSVAVDGDGSTIVAGSQSADSGAGEALVYQQTGGAWSSSPQTTTLTDSSVSQLGSEVAISDGGGTVVAASHDGADVFTDAGGSWQNQASLSVSDVSAVAVSGDGLTVALGQASAGASGQVVVYDAHDSTWAAAAAGAPAVLTDTSAGLLGESVAVSGDGQTVVAGAPASDIDAGEAVVFNNSGSSWSQTAVLSASGTKVLGASVAISADGATVAAGAPATNGKAGEALLFNENNGSWPASASQTYTGSGSEQLGEGVALSASGQTLALGAPGAGSGAGAVNFYSTPVPGFAATPTQKITGGLGETIGASEAVSANGRTIAIGTISESEVFVYTEAGGTWSLATTLNAPTGWGDGPEFGASLAISADGDTIAVGAPSAEVNGQSSEIDGAVAVYTATGGSWASTTNPTAELPGPSTESDFGLSVAISADAQTIAVGAANAGSEDDGQVAIYTDDGGTWPTTANATYTGTAYAELGTSVAVSGNGQTVVAGAPNAGQNGQGAVEIASDSGGSWPSTPTTLTGTSGGEEFGEAVALSADAETLAVGTPHANTDVNQSTQVVTIGGGVSLYSDTSGTWTDTANLTDPALQEFGDAVALSYDGDTLVAGAELTGADITLSSTSTPGPGAGVIYVNSGGSWSSTDTPTVTDLGGSTDLYLGASVGVSGDGQTALIGSPSSNTAAGQVSIFTQMPSTQTTATANATPYSAAAHTVTLGATVSSGGAPVTGGTVTFTVETSGQSTVGTPVTASVTTGTASASYTIPAGTPKGSYTIDAAYSGAGAGYGDSSDASQQLTITPGTQTVSFTSTAPLAPRFGAGYLPTAASSAGLTPLTLTVAASPSGSCVLTGGSKVIFRAVGRCVITATQAGNADYPAAHASQTVIVPKEKTSLKLTLARTNLAVTVTAPSGTPTGSVVFKANGKKIGTAKLNGGIAILKHTFAAGQVTALQISYAGSSQYLPAHLARVVHGR